MNTHGSEIWPIVPTDDTYHSMNGLSVVVCLNVQNRILLLFDTSVMVCGNARKVRMNMTAIVTLVPTISVVETKLHVSVPLKFLMVDNTAIYHKKMKKFVT